jgi:GTP:adenosylcobinamide-phosphate guanylyltransferase
MRIHIDHQKWTRDESGRFRIPLLNDEGRVIETVEGDSLLETRRKAHELAESLSEKAAQYPFDSVRADLAQLRKDLLNAVREAMRGTQTTSKPVEQSGESEAEDKKMWRVLGGSTQPQANGLFEVLVIDPEGVGRVKTQERDLDTAFKTAAEIAQAMNALDLVRVVGVDTLKALAQIVRARPRTKGCVSVVDGSSTYDVLFDSATGNNLCWAIEILSKAVK